jgi:hypothetical protein
VEENQQTRVLKTAKKIENIIKKYNMVEIISLIYSFLLFINHNFNPKKFKNHTHACVRLVYVFRGRLALLLESTFQKI